MIHHHVRFHKLSYSDSSVTYISSKDETRYRVFPMLLYKILKLITMYEIQQLIRI